MANSAVDSAELIIVRWRRRREPGRPGDEIEDGREVSLLSVSLSDCVFSVFIS